MNETNVLHPPTVLCLGPTMGKHEFSKIGRVSTPLAHGVAIHKTLNASLITRCDLEVMKVRT